MATRRNARAQNCSHCNRPVAAGAGELYRRWSDADDDFVGPYLVRCLDDREECDRVVAERAAAERAESARRAELSRAARAAVEALRVCFQAGEYPTRTREEGGSFVLEGEEVALGGGERAYGGGRWAVIEPATTEAVDLARIEALRAEIAAASAPLAALTEAYEVARAAIDAWAKAHGSFGHVNRTGVDMATKDLDARAEGYVLADAATAAYEALRAGRETANRYKETLELERLVNAAERASRPRAVWFVQNNGHDGDCWADNNVRTGGAGAIGWRLPWSAELEADVRAAGAMVAALGSR